MVAHQPMPELLAAPAIAAPSGRHHRVASLDGLRGVAALVVVVHHALLTVPVLSSAYGLGSVGLQTGSVPWLLTRTPLHLLWAGGEAVTVFFVLSGLVLAMPRIEEPRQAWDAYYLKRFVRLYLPVAAAVLLGTVLVYVPNRALGMGGSAWLNAHPVSVSAKDVLLGLTLAFGPPGAVNTALWSLEWEVFFSALLPVFLVTARLFRGRRTWLLSACALVLVAGPSLHGSLAYFPLFMCGVALALDGSRATSQTLDAGAPAAALWLGVALALLVLPWMVLVPGPQSWLVAGISRVAVAAGATMLVEVVRVNGKVATALRGRPFQWLGSRSFSLYLVHEPIVVASAVALGRTPDPRWFVPMMLVAALAAAEVFFRLVERPSLALATRAGLASSRPTSA